MVKIYHLVREKTYKPFVEFNSLAVITNRLNLFFFAAFPVIYTLIFSSSLGLDFGLCFTSSLFQFWSLFTLFRCEDVKLLSLDGICFTNIALKQFPIGVVQHLLF